MCGAGKWNLPEYLGDPSFVSDSLLLLIYRIANISCYNLGLTCG
jgi:hypothetical protein